MSGIERPMPVVSRGRLLAVDDDASFRALLRDVVRATEHLEIAGEADSGEAAIVAAPELRPDVVLMDIRMPGIGGIEAAEQIKAAMPSTLIVMASATHPDEIPARACAGLPPWCSGRARWRRGCSTRSGSGTAFGRPGESTPAPRPRHDVPERCVRRHERTSHASLVERGDLACRDGRVRRHSARQRVIASPTARRPTR
jgi:CheY-like chemotaxis protein